jgi:hypothetical protein
MCPRDSYPVLFFPLEGTIESLEKSFHLGHGTDWDELNSVVETNDLQLFPRTEAHTFSDTPRYDNLKLGREGYRVHIDLLSVIRVSYRYAQVNGRAFGWAPSPNQAYEKGPGARRKKLVPAKAGVQINNEAHVVGTPQ